MQEKTARAAPPARRGGAVPSTAASSRRPRGVVPPTARRRFRGRATTIARPSAGATRLRPKHGRAASVATPLARRARAVSALAWTAVERQKKCRRRVFFLQWPRTDPTVNYFLLASKTIFVAKAAARRLVAEEER